MKNPIYYLLGTALFLTNVIYAQDCPPPTCIQSFPVTQTQPDACVGLVYAKDLITPDPALCAPDTDFAIYRTSDVDAAGSSFIPNPADTFLIVATDASANTIVSVYVYIFITPSQYVTCTSLLLIIPNDGCDSFFSNISGTIATQEDETMAGVEVNTQGDIVSSMTTAADGAYSLFNVNIGYEFIISPYKNDAPLNGVTTFDLVLISKHILGLDLLDSPYDLIAADVNQSGSVSTLDIIQIRKLILGVYSEFPSSNSWRFVPANYVFPNPLNPWEETFPETINVLAENPEYYLDFIGIKMGDVNGNATAN